MNLLLRSCAVPVVAVLLATSAGLSPAAAQPAPGTAPTSVHRAVRTLRIVGARKKEPSPTRRLMIRRLIASSAASVSPAPGGR